MYQNIEESFRLNKINEAESKANSKRVTKNWSLPSNLKKRKRLNSRSSLRRQANSRMKFLKQAQGFLDFKIRPETLNKKFKLLPNNLKTELLKDMR